MSCSSASREEGKEKKTGEKQAKNQVKEHVREPAVAGQFYPGNSILYLLPKENAARQGHCPPYPCDCILITRSGPLSCR